VEARLCISNRELKDAAAAKAYSTLKYSISNRELKENQKVTPRPRIDNISSISNRELKESYVKKIEEIKRQIGISNRELKAISA